MAAVKRGISRLAPKLYMIDRSPPVRSVLLTAKALGITLEQVRLDFTKNEHLTPEFLKLNPQHTVPTLDDNGKILWDSHVINTYLVSQYGKGDALYPKDPYKRAIIDQRLHFNSGIMYAARMQIFKPILHQQTKLIPPEKAQLLLDAYGFLERFLDDNQWFAGDSLTLADLCLIPTITFNAMLVPIEEDTFPNITRWLRQVKALPYYNINQEGFDICKKLFDDLINA